jgi:hypothetical protein
VAGVVLIVGTTAAFAAVAVMQDGTITVDVHEAGGSQVSLAVPASLVRALLSVAPVVSTPELEQAMDEVRPHWPLVREASKCLARCPEGVLVEVCGRNEHVVVAKEGGDLVVRVRDGEDRVSVRVPASAVEDAVEAVGRMAGLD